MPSTLTRSTLLRPLLLLIAIAGATTLAVAQQQVEAPSVHLIPRPRQIELKSGVFQLRANPRLALADARSEDDRFAAEDFANDLRETANVKVRITTSRSRNSILVGTLSLAGIQSALLKSGVTPPSSLDEEGYVLVVNAQ